MNQKLENYIIAGGNPGSDRLKTLANATWQSSEVFLKDAGLKAGMHCLDLGCGNGEITLRLSNLVGPQGSITGIDADETCILIAREASKAREIPVDWKVGTIESDLAFEKYDFIYARFLLSHLRNPSVLLERIQSRLKPGGVIAVEDVDFAGHFSYPACPAFDRYVELYLQTGKQKGADPLIGPRLPVLLSKAGFTQPKMRVVLPTFMSGEGKRMAELTLKNIQSAIVEAGLAPKEEVERLVGEIADFTSDPFSIMSLPRIFQVCAIK